MNSNVGVGPYAVANQPPLNQTQQGAYNPYRYPAYGTMNIKSMPTLQNAHQRQQMPTVMNGSGTPNALPASQPASYMNQSYTPQYTYPSSFNYSMPNVSNLNGSFNRPNSFSPYIQTPQNKPIFAPKNIMGNNLVSKPKYLPKVSTGRRYFSGNNSSIGPPKPTKTYNCEICNVSCESLDSLKVHKEGRQHKKKEISTKDVDANKSNPLYCPICKSICSSRDSFKLHLEGKKHAVTVKYLKKNNMAVPEIKIPPPEPTESGDDSKATTKPKGNHSLQTIGENFVIKNPLKANTNEYFTCSLCKCGFSAEVSVKDHLSGRKHKLNYKANVDPNYVPDINLYVNSKSNEKNDKKGVVKSKKLSAKNPFQPIIFNPQPIMPMANGHAMPISNGSNVPIHIFEHKSISPQVFDKSENNKQKKAFEDYEQQILLNNDEIKCVEMGFEAIKNLLSSAKFKLSKADNKLMIREIISFGYFTEKAFIVIDDEVNFALVIDDFKDLEPTDLVSKTIDELITKEFSRFSSLEIAEVNEKERFILMKQKNSQFECNFRISIISKPYLTLSRAPEDWQKLDDAKLLELKDKIQQSKWVEATLCSSSVVCQCLRVLRALINENDELKLLGEWRLRVLIDEAAQKYFNHLNSTNPGAPITALGLFIFFFDFIGSGIALPSDLCPKIPDPVNSNSVDHIFTGINQDDLMNITSAAQKISNLIVMNNLDKVLVVED